MSTILEKAVYKLNEVNNYDDFINLLVEDKNGLLCIEINGQKLSIRNMLVEARANKMLNSIRYVRFRNAIGLVFKDGTSCLIEEENKVKRSIFIDGGEEYQSRFDII